jgi:transposase
MFSYVTPEHRVRPDHPLRPIRRMTDAALARLSPRLDRLYSTTGRPSIPPEQLLRALLLQILYSVRSERLLMEELDYSVLYRWFVGLSMDDLGRHDLHEESGSPADGRYRRRVLCRSTGGDSRRRPAVG